MNKLNFLKPLEDFQYSINLEYDLYDDNKIKSFLPTNSSLNIIEDVLYNVMNNSSSKSKILTGAYGKGKSHLTLTLLSLLSNTRNNELFSNLLSYAKKNNNILYKNIKLYQKNGTKLLPIIINTSSDELKTNLLNSLNLALKKEKLSNLMPETYFDVAIKTIELWKIEYPQTYKSFIKKINCPINEFIFGLKSFEQSKYNYFKNIFPILTSGSRFNPLQGTDVIKTYQSVISKLKENGYNGVFIVYDEFGKFLEYNVESNNTKDIKLLQDLAEKANRSKIDEQINLFLISHKSINNYVNHLSEAKMQNWDAVAGRFNEISIDSKNSEIFDMISQVLKKEYKEYTKFLTKNTENFIKLDSILRLKKIGTSNELFKNIYESLGTDFIVKIYPLHPYSAIILPKISELIAQNERTIFTYLASKDKNTVTYYINKCKDDFPLIEPNAIYDYFEELFKREPFGSNIREQWQIANSIINKLSNIENNELSIKIIKTLALIYIIDNFELIPPSLDLIFEIFLMNNSNEICQAIEILKKEELIIELEFKPYVKLRKTSNNNLKELISNEILRLNNNFNSKDILNSILSSNFLYPVNYNDKFEITRYFKFIFLTDDELLDINDIDSYIKNIESDGVIFGILFSDNHNRKLVLEKIKELNSKRVIYILPKKIIQINNFIKKYHAIDNLIKINKSDNLLIEELLYIKNDLFEIIKNFIDQNYLKPELDQTEYFYNKDKINIRRRANLSKLMSKICSDIFSKTPVIVNENINRNKLSSVMKTTRNRIINNILEDKLKPNLNLSGSQNLNVLRSVYVVPNLINDLENPIINYENCDKKIKCLIDDIDDFIKSSSEEKKNLSSLYKILVEPEYNYGLKKGIIPFYITIVIRKYKKHLIIFNKNKELKLNGSLILDINENPYNYDIKLENWDTFKELYIFNLKNIFNKYLKEYDNNLSYFDQVINAIQRWYLDLSKFDRETNYYCNEKGEIIKIDLSMKKFKSILNNLNLNARDFLFNKLPKIFKTENYEVIIENVLIIKNIIDNNLKNYIVKISNDIRKVFNANENNSIYSIFNNYYDSLSENTQSYLFTGNANSLLETIRESNKNDYKTINKLLNKFYSLNIEDFKDEYIITVNNLIKQAKNEIDDFDKNKQNEEFSNFTLIINNDDGTKRKINFEQNYEESLQSKMFYNNILSDIEDFNESLSNVEKSEILIKIIKDLL